MDLDDQLAALAAGELDDDTARALRARAAADPALAQRLARHRRLQVLLTDWDAPALSDEAAARLDAKVSEALAALGDEPLAERATPTEPVAASAQQAPAPDAPTVPDTAADDVADLGAARARREERRAQQRGLPAWVPGAAVAAVLLAVVGTGVLAGGGLVGGSDDAADTLADAPTLEADTAESDDEARDAEESVQDTTDSDEAAVGPAAPSDVDIAEGDLLALLDGAATGGQDDAAVQDDGDAAGDADITATDPGCVVEALERDTPAADGRDVWLTATGRYDDREATFVVIRTPGEQGDRFDVLAYDPDDCSLLASDSDSEVR